MSSAARNFASVQLHRELDWSEVDSSFGLYGFPDETVSPREGSAVAMLRRAVGCGSKVELTLAATVDPEAEPPTPREKYVLAISGSGSGRHTATLAHRVDGDDAYTVVEFAMLNGEAVELNRSRVELDRGPTAATNELAAVLLDPERWIRDDGAAVAGVLALRVLDEMGCYDAPTLIKRLDLPPRGAAPVDGARARRRLARVLRLLADHKYVRKYPTPTSRGRIYRYQLTKTGDRFVSFTANISAYMAAHRLFEEAAP